MIDAWETFGTKYGAAFDKNILERISYYTRKNFGINANLNYEIGCIIITNPVFFPKEYWVDVPEDWKDQIVVGKGYSMQSGVLLRSDIHKLYDRGYVIIDPDYNFKVNDRLKDEFNNGKTYYQLDKQKIWLPTNKSDWPSRENLEYHQQVLFKG